MAAGGAVAAGRVLIVGETGGTSSINEYIEATGGTGGYINSVPGSHHSGVHGNSDPNGGIGGTPNGRNGSHRFDSNEGGGRGPCPPGKGWALSLTQTDGTYGQGGLSRHIRNIRSVWVCCATGGSGGYDSKTISVNPGEILKINVGAGGEGISAGLDSYKHICWAEPGNDGFVLIQYESIIKDYYLNTTTTEDLSATDKAAPNVLELYLKGILGNEDEYEVKVITEDYGTIYEHYIVGTNKKYNTEVTSNILETEVITGVKGYSWKIDTNPLGEPNNTLGYDNDNDSTTEFPKTLPTSLLSSGKYYLHVKPIDNAGNVGTTKHLKLTTTTIKLTSHYIEDSDSNGYGPDYVRLSWTNSDPNEKYFYKVMQKSDGDVDWASVSARYDQEVRVLNVYPNVGNKLKGWMENPNSEEPLGYGKGLVKVTEVRITDFNSNPNGILKDASGQYKYDVIMFGSWDCNNGYDLSTASMNATDQFIQAGRGVLFGHDTFCNFGDTYHPNFNRLAHYVKAEPTRWTKSVGSSTVQVNIKGFLTKYPYDIETRKLTIPYSHTSGVRVPSDLQWIKFVDCGGSHNKGGDDGFNNYYLAAWNNCAFIRTGHSNGAATPDEQKILANVLFYLGQVTDDTEGKMITATDKAAPAITNIDINTTKQQIELKVEGIDYGSAYDHYVVGMKLLDAGEFYSNTVHSVVKTGIKKFQYTINTSPTTYGGTEYTITATDKEKCTIKVDKSYIGQYIHIRAVDNATVENISAHITIKLEDARTISKEEKDTTKELYCIEEFVRIPAEYDGSQSDATIGVWENGVYREQILKWPINISKIFETYIEDKIKIWNPYTQDGLTGLVDKSNSLGNYRGTAVKTANDAYAYILAHYKDNTNDSSDSQNALYEIIAEEEGRQGETSRRNTLYYEAKEYAKYRELIKQKGGFFTNQITHNVRVGYNIENEQYIVGPFEVDYVRSQTTITDKNGNKKKLEFSGIGVASGTKITNKNGIRIYDQNGKEIPQNTWTIEYDNKAEKEKSRPETYAEYGMPYPKEEFYIKLNKKGNEQTTEITKIEVQYYELEAKAQYRVLSGKYYEIEWLADNKPNKCEGGTLCPHENPNTGKPYEGPHTVGHTYFVSSEVQDPSKKSQDLLEIQSATMGYKACTQALTLTATKGENSDNTTDDDGDGNLDMNDDNNSGSIEEIIRLTMDFSGDIWNDKSENISNGLKEQSEKGIKGVEVFLIEKNTNKQIDSTVTNEKGEYIFKNVPVGLYYIKFTYDGQTYQTTRSFVRGSVEEYRTNGNGRAYTDISIVDETEEARQTLNNRFYEIKPGDDSNSGEALSTDKKITTDLEYRTERNTSTIITRDENEIAKEEFKLTVDTKEKDIYFPATNTLVVNGTPYLAIDDNNNINVGLSEREKTDTNVSLDLYQTIFSIKGNRQNFIHNAKQIRTTISDNRYERQAYIQEINPDDYNWRIEDYKENVSNETYQNIISIYGKNETEAAEKLELETYVEYIIILRNSGKNDTAYITELVDYYDENLKYEHSYRDFDKSSWIVIRNDDETESTYTGNNTQTQIYWSKGESRYGKEKEFAGFDNLYANLEEYGIKQGQYAEIHLIFQVEKDNNGNIKIDKNMKNAAEINGYRTLNTETGKVVGLIDIDSKPGDLNPNETAGIFEDDEDKSPEYRLELGNNGNGANGSGDKTDGSYSDGTGDDVQTDPNGNPIGYFGNTIEGNVWEDLKGDPLEADGRRISNGIMDDGEEKINDIKVELHEIIGGVNTKGEYQEIDVNLSEKQNTRTTKTFLLTDNKTSDGAYRFSNLTAGKYSVHFIYGEAEQLSKNLKYNGQDYQGVSSDKIYRTDKIAGSYEDTEIMLVLDNSNSMAGIKIESVRNAANILIDRIKERLPGVEIGVVNFNEITGTIGTVNATETVLKEGINKLTAKGETAIGKGIVAGIEGFDNGKTKIMLLITDGNETVETDEIVINQINQLINEKIQLITLLTSQSNNIFGTEEIPRYGKVYQIEENNRVTDNMVEKIYQEIISRSYIEENRSLGDDIEGTEENPEVKTRWYQIKRYQEMSYAESAELDIEGISKMPEGTEKQNKIATLAEHTAMESVTPIIEIYTNTLGEPQVHEVNQALIERPTANLTLTQEIGSIKVILSDGTVLVDTAKGVSKNVLGLDVPDADVHIYMDEEIMQGATVEVVYNLKVVNNGEVDRLSNYFEGASDDTITTTAKVIYAYLSNSIVYRGEDNQKLNEEGNPEDVWYKTTEGDWELDLSPETIEGLENIAKITLKTTSLEDEELYPLLSKEVKTGIGSATTNTGVQLMLSKLISPDDDQSSSLTYDCVMELTVRGNEAGRRVANSILGNHTVIDPKDLEDGTQVKVESSPDEATTRSIIITKPFGENRNITKPILIALSILTTIATGIIISKSKK